MKKIIIILIVLIGIFLVISNMGLSCNNFRIGHQDDFLIPQSTSIEESHFYKNYYQSDKLTVINFWATWCKPCIKEMPDLNYIKNQFEGKPIHFLSFSIDRDSVKLVNFLNTRSFDFKEIKFNNLEYETAIKNLLEGKSLDNHLLTYAIPKTYLLKNGQVLKRINGGVDKSDLINAIKNNLQE